MSTVKGYPVNRIISFVTLQFPVSVFALIGLLIFNKKALAGNHYQPVSKCIAVMASITQYPTFFIPPLSTTHSWEMASFNNFLGYSMEGGMDINGDGFGDFIAGANTFRNGAFVQAGYANAHFGSAAGVSGSPYWEIIGTDYDMYLGYNVAGAGDVNNDGYDDVLIQGLMYNRVGFVRLYMGHAGGLSTTIAWSRSPSATTNTFYGWCMTRAGDLNGDGYDDIAIGTPEFYNGTGSRGLVEVFYGSATGIPATPSWTAKGNTTTVYFGGSVAASDVNGDGYNDLIVGASRSPDGGVNLLGKVFIYYGSSGGLGATPNQTYMGQIASELLGETIKDCGDLNNDGYGDILMSREASYIKLVSFYYGSAAGLRTSPGLTIQAADASNAIDRKMIGTAMDINADGCSDVILGCQSCVSSTGKKGTVSIYFGKPEGLQSTPAWKIENTTLDYYYMGRAVGTAGDVNGDGFGDILISNREIFYLGSADRHSLALYMGGTITLPVTLSSFSYQCVNNQPRLSWRTDMESNTKQFGIEQSTNGSNWQVIGTVPALGTHQGPREYHYERSLPVPAQYRLRITDLDGTTSYSKILHIKNTCDDDEQFTWTVSPNPSLPGGKLQINISNYPYDREPVKVQLTDMKGYRQSLTTLTIPGNTVQYMTDVSLPPMLPAGVYVLSIGNSHLRESRRVLVSK